MAARRSAPNAGLGVGGCLLALALIVGAYALVGLGILLLWNIVVPYFGGPHITLLVALAGTVLLSALGSLLFGSAKK